MGNLLQGRGHPSKVPREHRCRSTIYPYRDRRCLQTGHVLSDRSRPFPSVSRPRVGVYVQREGPRVRPCLQSGRSPFEPPLNHGTRSSDGTSSFVPETSDSRRTGGPNEKERRILRSGILLVFGTVRVTETRHENGSLRSPVCRLKL